MSDVSRRIVLQSGLASLASAAFAGPPGGASEPSPATTAPVGRPVEKSRNTIEQIACFALNVRDDELSSNRRSLIQRNLLDTLGCAIGALDHGPTNAIRTVVGELGGAASCTMIGGGRTAPDRATLFNGCLVRYLDFMDNFHLKKEACHPCDTVAGLLAAAEVAGSSGQALLTAIAVAYQVHCRLLEELGAMRVGMNHTTPQAVAVAAGASRLLGLSIDQTQNAIALATDCGLSLAVTQAEPVSQWKGLSSGHAGEVALRCVFLARAGITGPIGVFDGPLGLHHLIRSKAELNWDQEKLDVIERTSIKRYNAEFHAQPAIEGLLALRAEHHLGPDTAVESITIDTFREAFEVIGGGTYGPKADVDRKEQADHNLLYIAAVALLDGEVGPSQYTSERIDRSDVQSLLKRIVVRPSNAYSLRYPEETIAKITIKLGDGRTLTHEQRDWLGFRGRPMSWDDVRAKFDKLSAKHADGRARNAVAAAVQNLPNRSAADLMQALTLGRS